MRRPVTPGCGGSTPITAPCWSPRSTLIRSACANAPGPVKPYLVLSARPDPWTRAPPPPPCCVHAAAQSCDRTAAEVPGPHPWHGSQVRRRPHLRPWQLAHRPSHLDLHSARSASWPRTARNPGSRPNLPTAALTFPPSSDRTSPAPRSFCALSVDPSRANAVSFLLRSCSRGCIPALPWRFGNGALGRSALAGPRAPIHPSWTWVSRANFPLGLSLAFLHCRCRPFC